MSTEFVAAVSIWQDWGAQRDYKFSDFTEALNCGYNQVVTGCFEKEVEVQA